MIKNKPALVHTSYLDRNNEIGYVCQLRQLNKQ